VGPPLLDLIQLQKPDLSHYGSKQYRSLLTRALPGVSSSVAGTNQTVSLVIPLPGQEASLTVVRNTAEKALRIAKESALPPHGPMIDYWGHGGGMPRCPEGYVVVRAYEVGGKNNMRMHCQKIAR